MTITVTPTLESSNLPPRVRLNISASAGEISTTVNRLDPDGTLVPVRTNDGAPLALSAGTGLVYDYEVPYGRAVSFSSLESPTTVSAQVTIPEARVWLIHPGVPALSMPIEARAGSFGDEQWDVQQGVFWPMGRDAPVVQTDGQRKAPASSVTVAIESAADLQALRDLVADAGVLLLNVPPAAQIGVDTNYVAVGSIRNRRPSDIGSDPNRSVEMPLQVVDRPVGGSQSQRTLLDILAAYSTLDAVRSAYPTLNAVLAGP